METNISVKNEIMPSSRYLYDDITKNYSFECNCSCSCRCYKKELKIINKIDDIKVQCMLNIRPTNHTNYQYKMILSSPNIYVSESIAYQCCEQVKFYEKSYVYDGLTLENINTFLLELKGIIRNLKFNKLFGKFVLSNEFCEDEFGIDIFGLEFCNAQECCVCLDKTLIKTDCEHYLCLACWSNLKNNSCPICRKNDIMVYNDEDNSQEYNEEFSSDDEDDEDDENEDQDEEDEENEDENEENEENQWEDIEEDEKV